MMVTKQWVKNRDDPAAGYAEMDLGGSLEDPLCQ
jgi:hypothetical protein